MASLADKSTTECSSGLQFTWQGLNAKGMVPGNLYYYPPAPKFVLLALQHTCAPPPPPPPSSVMKFDIKIISDTVCPWCYVGKRRIDAGIAAYRAANPSRTDDTFSISWHPFYLDPGAPVAGEDKAARYERRFGAAKFAAIRENLAAAGCDAGIAFSFGGRTGHTRDSHRLIRFAGQQQQQGDDSEAMQNRVVAELFARYFEREADITDRAVLRAAAEAAGLDGDEVARYLASDEGVDEVEDEVLRAQQLGVNGVPNIRINGLFEAPGAVDADIFRQIFEKIAEVSEGQAGGTA
jgi:predicted DsbA family dithiol-disulfide isomerase